jgi:hypothetical protein
MMAANIINVFSTTGLYLRIVKMENFMLCVFDHEQKLSSIIVHPKINCFCLFAFWIPSIHV